MVIVNKNAKLINRLHSQQDLFVQRLINRESLLMTEFLSSKES